MPQAKACGYQFIAYERAWGSSDCWIYGLSPPLATGSSGSIPILISVPLQKVHMKDLDQNDLAGVLRNLCSGYCRLSVPLTHRRVRKPLTRNKDPKQIYDNLHSKLWKHSCLQRQRLRGVLGHFTGSAHHFLERNLLTKGSIIDETYSFRDLS